MRTLLFWLGRQLDGGVTAAGAAVVLLLLAGVVVAALALASGQLVVASLAGGISLLVLTVLLATALVTAPQQRPTPAQRKVVWAAIPRYFRVGILVLLFGGLAQATVLLLSPLQHAGLIVSHASLAMASLFFGLGFQRDRPPIPRPHAPPIRPEQDLQAYALAARPVILSCYVGAAVFAALAVYGAVKSVL